MRADSAKSRIAFSALAGAFLGYFILHPYTMLVYGLYEVREGTASLSAAYLFSHLAHVLKPDMAFMGIPFALLGAAAGLFFGFWLNARRQREDMEKRACAVDTMKQLMVTLSHYLLNASTVIGGYASHVMKTEDDHEIKKHLEVIKTEAECVEAVVKSLQSIESVVTEHYTKDSETTMIDIQRQLEERIKESVGKSKATPERKAA